MPAGNLLEHREAAHAIAAELRLDVNVVDDRGRKHEAATQQAGVALQLPLGRRGDRRSLFFSSHNLYLCF